LNFFNLSGEAIQCYQCSDIETESSSRAIPELNSKTTSACGSGMGAHSVFCPEDNICALVKGTAEFNYFLGMYSWPFLSFCDTFISSGKVKAKVYVRDCTPTTEIGITSGCSAELRSASAILNEALSFVDGLSGLNVDADVCVCAFDLCNPDPCDDGNINIASIGW
jgi:hypothetical protein